MSNVPPASTPKPARRSALPVFLPVFVVAIAGAAYYGYVVHNSKPEPSDDQKAIRSFIATIPQGQKLADTYRDANNDLVADAPTEAGKIQKVDEIGFSVVAGDDPVKTKEEWKDFIAALEKATGKKVVFRGELGTLPAQLAALREGKLHVTAFSTGTVAMAVNTAGFVPLATPADAEGKYSYEMEILTAANSSIRTPADLKGKTIAFTSLSSNSGAKAPLVILKDKFGLLPMRDYKYVPTGSHERSMKELADGKHDAICVANDLLARAVASGHIKKEQYRSIFKSESFPPLCLGIAHDLPPELAASIKKVFQDFRFDGSSLAKRYTSQGKSRFGLVDYKRDWAYVRQIDDALTRLLDNQ